MDVLDYRRAVEAAPSLERETVEAIMAAGPDLLGRWWSVLNSWEWPDDLPGVRPAAAGTIGRAFELVMAMGGYEPGIAEWNRRLDERGFPAAMRRDAALGRQ